MPKSINDSAQHQHKVALLISDMLNTFDFPEARQLLPGALNAAKAISRLKKRVKALGIPVIYINDNFGQWESDWRALFESCIEESCLGKEIAHLLKPEDDDYFVLKPKHSGFYGTTLEILLDHIGAEKLIITGVAGNICVLFTAHDAYMREYDVLVPKDCIASNNKHDNDYAIQQLEVVCKINTKTSTRLSKTDFKSKSR